MRATLKVGLVVSLLAMFGLAGCGFIFDTSEEALECGAGETACAGACFDTDTSAHHCGACGVQCDTGESCENGACTEPEPCQPGQCAEGQFCNEQSGRCVSGCNTDSQCGARQFCDIAANECACSGELTACGDACCERVTGEQRLSSGDYSTLDLALDSAGRAHIVTQPQESADIEYLVPNDEGSFDSDIVHFANSSASVPGGQTLDVDPSGTPHVAFLERRDERATLYHTSLADGVWTAEQIDRHDGGYAIPSILAPAADEIYLAYRSIRPELAHYELESGTWNKTSLTGEAFLGAPQLAMDREGVVRIAFWDAEHDAMRVIEPLDLASGPQFETGPLLRAPALAFDSGNHPHVAFGDAETFELTYAKYDGDGWTQEVIGRVREGADPRMALDSEDNPHIVYVREGSTQVLYAWRGADGWHKSVVGETVDGNPYSSERWVDIEMADGDVPVLAFVRADGRISVVRPQQ